jgi:hypothetical protein
MGDSVIRPVVDELKHEGSTIQPRSSCRPAKIIHCQSPTGEIGCAQVPAAGTAAVQAIRSGQKACDLDTAQLVETLRNHGAYLPQADLSRTMTR